MGKCQFRGMSFEEVSFKELSVGEPFVEEMSSGKCPSGKYPSGEYPWGHSKSTHLHFVNFTLSPPLCCSLKIKNYGMREKRIFFVCIAASAYRVVSKEGENRIMDTIAFLDTHGCMNNPY